MKFVRILGVNFPLHSQATLEKKLFYLLKSRRFSQVVTPNPEILLLADQDDEYMNIIRQADLLLPDGFGLIATAKLKGFKLSRLSGSDVLESLLKELVECKLKALLIVKEGGLSSVKEIKHAIIKKFPELNFKIVSLKNINELDGYLNEIKEYRANLALIGLGAPDQDKLADIFKKKRLANLSMGIGGSFDFLSGRIKRAPAIFRKLGFEWFWRLLCQPTRIKRIYNAIFKFLGNFFVQEFVNKHFYRPNVVGFIINKQNEVLIVNSNKEVGRDFWKLPQGGRDRYESAEKAIRREMFEELALDNLDILAYYPKVYSYKWPKNYSIRGFKGQCQSLFILQYVNDNQAIKLNAENKDYKWIKIDDLLNMTSLVTREAYKIFLKKYQETIK